MITTKKLKNRSDSTKFCRIGVVIRQNSTKFVESKKRGVSVNFTEMHGFLFDTLFHKNP